MQPAMHRAYTPRTPGVQMEGVGGGGALHRSDHGRLSPGLPLARQAFGIFIAPLER